MKNSLTMSLDKTSTYFMLYTDFPATTCANDQPDNEDW